MALGVPDRKCCPTPPPGEIYAYVDSVGDFFNVYTGTIMNMVSWTGGPVTDIYGKCVKHQAFPSGYGSAEDPIDCPCCPPNYTYIQNYTCTRLPNLKDVLDPIPCVVCVCPDPPPPPVCPDCQERVPHVTLAYPSNIKLCEDCNKADGELPAGKIQAFVAINLLNPVVNFKLK